MKIPVIANDVHHRGRREHRERRRTASALLCALCVLCGGAVAGDLGAQPTLPLTRGMLITTSVRIAPGTYRIPADASLDSALMVIRGEGITVDMRGVRVEGTAADADPDEAQGVAIRVDGGRDIAIRGATIRGYRVAVLSALLALTAGLLFGALLVPPRRYL